MGYGKSPLYGGLYNTHYRGLWEVAPVLCCVILTAVGYWKLCLDDEGFSSEHPGGVHLLRAVLGMQLNLGCLRRRGEVHVGQVFTLTRDRTRLMSDDKT